MKGIQRYVRYLILNLPLPQITREMRYKESFLPLDDAVLFNEKIRHKTTMHGLNIKPSGKFTYFFPKHAVICVVSEFF